LFSLSIPLVIQSHSRSTNKT